ncbi:hypothetical protein [Thermodesulfatator indicus]|uniref:hypothetical protein n=1 Tax=Thermodesulfatator indicus TaxID=171695 RepID=UPI0011D261B2|nr:hypothetical protein [Thermodesulfatator indicus]
MKRLEYVWGRRAGFNCKPFSFDDLLVWIENLGAIPLQDRTVKVTTFLFYRDKKFILYNTGANPLELLLSLGHEAGHLALGHYETGELLPHAPSLWARNGLEKDAGIVGFLCWLPTPEFERILQKTEPHPEVLANELATCDSEWPFLLKASEARLRIWRGLRKISKHRHSFFD